jgi:amidase
MMPHHLRSRALRSRAGRLLAGLLLAGLSAGLLSAGLAAGQAAGQRPPVTPPGRSVRTFHVEEATIADVHRAIQQGETTCKAIVQSYIERARAYDGACVQLVTRDGASVPAVTGAVRGGTPGSFPTSTAAIGSVLPNFDEYVGPPIEFGRMEATSSDPTVHQQYGMVTGIPNAGQVNALSTLNIRGERSVYCKAECDAAPSSGPLPASCPKACDAFRKQPDALERAAALDAQYGRDRKSVV